MTKNQPFLTIFTPNYNNSKFISETIESIINQTYSNFEYIIIDDCSTDNSWEIIQSYAKKDTRIKIYRNKKNLQIVNTRNKGFKFSSSRSKYFAIIDSDDVALPIRLEIQVKFLEKNPDYGLIGSNISIINNKSEDIGYRIFPSRNKVIKKYITRYNPFAQSSVMLRKKVIEEIGFYDKKWNVCQDYDYWLRVGKSWKLGNINKKLVKYRISKTQIKLKKIRETIKNTYKIQEKAIKKYGYKDTVFNKLWRILLKLFLIYPKFAYYLHMLILKILKKNYYLY